MRVGEQGRIQLETGGTVVPPWILKTSDETISSDILSPPEKKICPPPPLSGSDPLRQRFMQNLDNNC